MGLLDRFATSGAASGIAAAELIAVTVCQPAYTDGVTSPYSIDARVHTVTPR